MTRRTPLRPLPAARAAFAVLLAAAGAGIALATPQDTGATAPRDETTSEPARTLDTGFSFMRMNTDKGEMHILLDGPAAPLTVENFLEYVDAGFFDGTIFHRVIPDFVIQGGGFAADGERRQTRPGVRNEWQNGLKNDHYSLSMARVGGRPHSGTSQFFINTKDNAALDAPRDGAAYAVFGVVVDGRPVVDAIEGVETATGTLAGNDAADVPVEPVRIRKASRMMAGDLSEAGRANALAWQRKYADARAAMASVSERLTRARTLLSSVEPRDSGLKTAVVTEGEGPTVPLMSQIVVKYTGWLADDGWLFDTSIGKAQGDTYPMQLQPGGLIEGWIEGIPLMRKGETRVFEIPASLGYRERGAPPIIPGNATLIFEVTVEDFTPPTDG